MCVCVCVRVCVCACVRACVRALKLQEFLVCLIIGEVNCGAEPVSQKEMGLEYCTTIYLTDLKVLTIGHTTVDCGETNGVTIGDTYFVEGDGQSPGVNCTYTFTSELDASCQGLCYNMTNDSFFRDELATLTITSGSYSKVSSISN